MFNLHILTFHALRNILSNVLFHSWPKILLSGCRNCLLISQVTIIWSLMDLIHNNSAQICYIWNINYVFVSKKSIFFQFISLIPLLNTFLQQFVLYLHIHFIFSSMINNMLSQIWLEKTKRFHKHFMHLPAECVNHFVFFSFYVFDFKIKITQKLQPSRLPNIQSWLIKQVFQTTMVCP